jgi:hypothetical protein
MNLLRSRLVFTSFTLLNLSSKDRAAPSQKTPASEEAGYSNFLAFGQML